MQYGQRNMKWLVLSLGVLLTACGGNGSDNPSNTTSSPTQEAPNTPEPVTPNLTPNTPEPTTHEPTPNTPEPATPNPNPNPTPEQPTEAPTETPTERPAANISGATASLVDTVVTLSANSSTGENITYAWTLIAPSASTTKLNSNNAVETTFTPDIAGNYQVNLVITDKNGAKSTTNHTIQVTQNKDGIPLKLTNTDTKALKNAPFTFAQPFAVGSAPKNQQFALKLLSSNALIPLQTDAKASHKDGSLRHAIFSGRLPSLSANETIQAEIIPFDAVQPKTAINLSELLATELTSVVSLNIDGKPYTLSLKDALKTKQEKLWLDGNIVREWVTGGAFKDASGAEHPHLYGRFNLRVFGNAERVLLDVVVENNWMYEKNPKNTIYDVAININGKRVYSHDKLSHINHTRWRKKFWVNETPSLHIASDVPYLIGTKAIPNYDQSLIGKMTDAHAKELTEKWVDKYTTYAYDKDGKVVDASTGGTEFRINRIGPMGIGRAFFSMPAPGARPDIGPLPRWVAVYLLNQDNPLAKKVALGNTDLAGSWPIHFRDKNTDRPVSIDTYPYASVLWNQTVTYNPKTKKREGPAPCVEENKALCRSPYRPDTAHQPFFAYVPYLLTGDYYYLEELQFWANYNFLSMNTAYRRYEKGLFLPMQVRGQGWSMRTLGYTTYITPDTDPMKDYFKSKLMHNIEYYIDTNVKNPQNNYGALRHKGDGLSSTWMDDFFNWAAGEILNLGYTEIEPLVKWKSTYPVQRMGFGTERAKKYCWIYGAAYQLVVAPDKKDMLKHIDEVFDASRNAGKLKGADLPCNSIEQARTLGIALNQMNGYSGSPAGFPSNMQIALATAVDNDIEGAQDAWRLFETRVDKPGKRFYDYPNYAIVPRKPVPLAAP